MAITHTCDRCGKTIDATSGVAVFLRNLENGQNLAVSDLCLSCLTGGLNVPDSLKAPAAPDQAGGAPAP